MTVRDQLTALRRQFPRATELAVSPEMRDAVEAELVEYLRHHSVVTMNPPGPVMEYGPMVLQSLTFSFRGIPLTLVTHA